MNEKTTIEATVFGYIASYFKVDLTMISRSTVADDIVGWDSMANAEIVLGLEDELGVELEPEDLLKLDDVGCLIDVLTHKTTA